MNYLSEAEVVREQLTIRDILSESVSKSRVDQIKEGLLSPKKYIQPKFFYDEIGSKLFEEITLLEEYYPTVTEKKILSSLYSKLNIDITGYNIVELGSGDHTKISLLLNVLPKEVRSTITYCPVDISKSAIERAASFLNIQYPELSIAGVVADFIQQVPQLSFPGKSLFLFLGSTIGNLSYEEQKLFMTDISSIMRPGDRLLLGMDLVKDKTVLEKAYNDSRMVTEQFNKNVLRVINKVMGSSLNTGDFEHHAFFNEEKSRIEMHLIAKRKLVADLPIINQQIVLKQGESIHTENSHKFNDKSIEEIGSFGNLCLEKKFTDDKEWFSLSLFRK